ncbi:MAG: hypothetical protein U5O39_01780 [Gammaproteobacteria bacterium]|nr:hypothetical protein [Gammaproteobacteria bacterium]
MSQAPSSTRTTGCAPGVTNSTSGYDEIEDHDPADLPTLEYFDLLKTTETTPSGRPKDNFHFTLPTDEWREQSQSGVSAGYGANFAIIAGSPPRQVVVLNTEARYARNSGRARARRRSHQRRR